MAATDDFDDLLLDDYETNISSENTNNVLENPPTAVADEPLAQTIRKKKLDPELLLSPEGLPYLKSRAQNLRFSGQKGFEDQDLNKLITYYTVWAHSLFPKLRFQDFTRRVVKQTSKALVKEQVERWQQEYKDRRQVRMGIRNEMMREEQEEEEDEEEEVDNRQGSRSNSSERDRQAAHDEKVKEDRPLFAFDSIIHNKDKGTAASTETRSGSKKRKPASSSPNNAIFSDDEAEDEPLFVNNRSSQKSTKRRIIALDDSDEENDDSVRN